MGMKLETLLVRLIAASTIMGRIGATMVFVPAAAFGGALVCGGLALREIWKSRPPRHSP
jgi:hypothetical protein